MAIPGRSMFQKFGFRSQEREDDRDNPNSGARRSSRNRKQSAADARDEKQQRQERSAFHASLKSSRTEVQKLTNSFIDLNKEIKKFHSSLKNINALSSSQGHRTAAAGGTGGGGRRSSGHGSGDMLAKFIKENPQFKGNKQIMEAMKHESEQSYRHQKGSMAVVRRAWDDVAATVKTIAPGITQSLSEIYNTVKQLSRITWPIFRAVGWVGKKLLGRPARAAGRGLAAGASAVGRSAADVLTMGVSSMLRNRRRRRGRGGGATEEDEADVGPDARGAELGEEVKQSQIGMAANIQTMTDLFTGDGAWVRIKNAKDVGGGEGGAGERGWFEKLKDWFLPALGIGALLRNKIWDLTKWGIGKLWDLTKWGISKVWEGVRWGAGKLWEGARWGAGKLWEGAKWGAGKLWEGVGKLWEGSKWGASKLWEGAKWGASKLLEGARWGASKLYEGASKLWEGARWGAGKLYEVGQDILRSARSVITPRPPTVEPPHATVEPHSPAVEPHPTTVRGMPDHPVSPNKPSVRPQIKSPTGPKIRPARPSIHPPRATVGRPSTWGETGEALVRGGVNLWKKWTPAGILYAWSKPKVAKALRDGEKAAIEALQKELIEYKPAIDKFANSLRPMESKIPSKLKDPIVKMGEKFVVKTVGSVAGRLMLRAIPPLAAAVGVFFAVERFMEGDYVGATLELIIAASNFIPGIWGLAIGLVGTGLLVAYDLWRSGAFDRGAAKALIPGRDPSEEARSRKIAEDIQKRRLGVGEVGGMARAQAEREYNPSFGLSNGATSGATKGGVIGNMLSGMDKFKSSGASPISFNSSGSTEAEFLKNRAAFDATNALVNASAKSDGGRDDRLTRAIYTLAETVVATSRQSSVTRPQPNLATEVAAMPQVAAYSLGTV